MGACVLLRRDTCGEEHVDPCCCCAPVCVGLELRGHACPAPGIGLGGRPPCVEEFADRQRLVFVEVDGEEKDRETPFSDVREWAPSGGSGGRAAESARSAKEVVEERAGNGCLSSLEKEPEHKSVSWMAAKCSRDPTGVARPLSEARGCS
mmetsp:Transcript_79150/g.235843  ORF Transcript_79150/g.235843 Transcript_79150/m.235843 type:complete len:150 (-) Transcript_79150:632-1081(-)